jgi:hypothetical protein
MDQRARQTGLDVIERLADLLGAPIDDVTPGRLGDQVVLIGRAPPLA